MLQNLMKYKYERINEDMDIIDIPRGYGKTWMAINRAKETGYPIIVDTIYNKGLLIKRLHEYECENIKVYTANEWIEMRNKLADQVIVDELPMVLCNLFGARVDLVTLSSREY